MPFACNTFESIASPRKRPLEEEEEEAEGPSSECPRTSPRVCSHEQPETQIPTPSRSTPFTHEQNTRDHAACARLLQRLPQAEPRPRKQAIESCPNEALHSSKRSCHTYTLQRWLNDYSTDKFDQKKRLEDIGIGAPNFDQQDGLDDIRSGTSDQDKELRDDFVITSIDQPMSLLDHPTNDWEADDDDQMSHQRSQVTVSAVSAQTESLDPTSPAYVGTLKRNSVIIDQAGLNIPEEVKRLIDMRILKRRKSPRLDHSDQAKIKNNIIRVWHKAETTVSEIIRSPLFDLQYPTLAEGGNTLWTKQPLPRNPNAPFPILIPKPDKHFGFQHIIDSDWNKDELSVIEYPVAQPYMQPSPENIWPCLMIEIKSEATKGNNLYTAEAQAAGAGAHRVRSLLWLLDEVEPDRKRASTDALAFTTVVSQREAVAYVNFYDPDKNLYYMSFIDSFYFVKNADAQGCRDHHKNVAEWMLGVMQPLLRDLLTKAHPISKAWRTMVDPNESFASNNGLSNKNPPKEQDAEPEPGSETQTQSNTA